MQSSHFGAAYRADTKDNHVFRDDAKTPTRAGICATEPTGETDKVSIKHPTLALEGRPRKLIQSLRAVRRLRDDLRTCNSSSHRVARAIQAVTELNAASHLRKVVV